MEKSEEKVVRDGSGEGKVILCVSLSLSCQRFLPVLL